MKRNQKDTSILRLIQHLDVKQDRLLYTYKAQEKAADRYNRYNFWRRITSLLLTAFTTGAFLTTLTSLIGNQTLNVLLISGAAFLATVVSFLGDFFDFSEESKRHHNTAAEIRLLHNKYEWLICDLESGKIDYREARYLSEIIQEKEFQLLSMAPRTTRRDYKKASKAIDTDEKPISTQEDINKRSPGRNLIND